jgi:hypothetical protein
MGLSGKRLFTVFIFLTALCLMIATANARIDLLTASFESDWVDLDVDGVKLERHYSSRSTHNGLFGYGWCSELETSIEFTAPTSPNQSLYLKECDRRTEFKFDAALDAFKGPSGRTITRTEDSLTLRNSGKISKTFNDQNGRMKTWTFRTGRTLILDYDRRGLLQDAATGEGLRMRITMDALLGKIRAIHLPQNMSLTFDYQDLNLIKAKNAWSNSYLFTYDDLHNLTHIAYPDNSTEEILYDTDRDQVLLYTGRSGCKENYSYTNTPGRMIAEAIKYCHDQPVGKIKLEVDSTHLTFTRNGVKQVQEIAR